jgi:hypothetical protein
MRAMSVCHTLPVAEPCAFSGHLSIEWAVAPSCRRFSFDEWNEETASSSGMLVISPDSVGLTPTDRPVAACGLLWVHARPRAMHTRSVALSSNLQRCKSLRFATDLTVFWRRLSRTFRTIEITGWCGYGLKSSHPRCMETRITLEQRQQSFRDPSVW